MDEEATASTNLVDALAAHPGLELAVAEAQRTIAELHDALLGFEKLADDMRRLKPDEVSKARLRAEMDRLRGIVESATAAQKGMRAALRACSVSALKQ